VSAGALSELSQDEEEHGDVQSALQDAYEEAADWFIKGEEANFTREITRRATENLSVEYGSNGSTGRVDRGELREFLMNLDDFQQMFLKLERRVRDPRVVEVLGNAALRVDKRTDFSDQANLDVLAAELRKAGVPTEVKAGEEHSAFYVMFHDLTNAESRIGVDLAHRPEYRKYRVLANEIAEFNKPPFTVFKNENRDIQTNWRDLLEHVKMEGVKRLCNAGMQGDVRAQYMLAFAYRGGRGVTCDENLFLGSSTYGQRDRGGKEVYWCATAAEQGHARAQCYLGLVLTEFDSAEGAIWIRKAAEQGVADAQYILGILEGGVGHHAEAAKWYHMAAEQEHRFACEAAQFLGVAYETGDGVAQDHKEAAKWHRKAAEGGIPGSQYHLAKAYHHGHGVPQDFVQGHAWSDVAASSEDIGELQKNSSSLRREVAAKMTPDEISEARRLARDLKSRFR
jgi:TPR repeat protein